MSVSKIECSGSVRGKGRFVLGLYRHMAPVTVAALIEALPLAARAMPSYQGVMVTLLTSLKVGVEKQRLEFEKGDLAFLPANGSICVFLAGAKSQRPLSPLGKVEEGLEVLSQVGSGDVVEISAPQSQEAGVQT